MTKQQTNTPDNQAAIIDGKSLRVLTTPPTIHLKTVDDIRLEMGKVYRLMRLGKLDMADGTKLVYVLGQMGKLIEISELEKRIQALETHL